ncbi:hypothetical protein RUM44_003821 [Polyplax serrata]|uniref:Calponin-homology (CH) domain-containing protein n=1 Tax=Polyplax serrata TaxID=468196 RepID=A0ABR1B123_POLSC
MLTNVTIEPVLRNELTVVGVEGNVDIVNGNLKLILGLIWSLIVRYQIGRSKFPPKKLMLAWLKAVLPECNVHNFTTDWNSGQCLSALLDYCKPGLFPHWRNIDPTDRVNNCRRAMELARREFDIPVVLEPEYLASPFLDELSGMTYLSYFMKENGPGYNATLRWVQNQIPDRNVKNFTTNWNDGRALCSLVKSLGGSIPGYKTLNSDPSNWEHNLNLGVKGGEKLGVEPILKAKDMADKNVEHLGIMAYAANFQWIPGRIAPSQRIKVTCDKHASRVNENVTFNIEFLDEDIDVKDIKTEVVGPLGKVDCKLNLGQYGGKGSFSPTTVGMHQVNVLYEGEKVMGCPVFIRVAPELTNIDFPGIEPCAIGSIVEVLVNSYGGNTSNVVVTAWSPTDRALPCPVHSKDGQYTAKFQPDEVGEWSIAVTHKGEHIQGGPFPCFVFDPNGIKLLNTEGALPNVPFTFLLDASETGGVGDITVDLVHDKRSIPHTFEKIAENLYKIYFVPRNNGKYRVYVYFNGMDVRGSPFPVRVGTKKKKSNLMKTTVKDVLSKSAIPDSPSPMHYIRTISPILDNSSPLYSPQVVKQTEYMTKNIKPPNSEDKCDYVTVKTIHLKDENHPPPPRFNVLNGEPSKKGILRNEKAKSNVLSSDSFKNELFQYVKGTRSPISSEIPTTKTSIFTVKSPIFGQPHKIERIQSPIDRSLSPIGSSYRISTSTYKSTERTSSPALKRTSPTTWNDRKNSDLEDNIEKLSSLRVTKNESYSSMRNDTWDSTSKTDYITRDSRDYVDATHSRFLDRGSISPKPRGKSPIVSSPLPGMARGSAHGDSLKLVPINRQSVIDLDFGPDVSPNDISVIIVSPSRKEIPVRVMRSIIKKNLTAAFSTTEVGEHYIDIRYKNQRINGSPFRTHAYNPRAIKVGNIPNGRVGEPVEFEIDGSGAGSGNLEILVNGGHVTSFVKNLGDQRFLASFVPHEALVHIIDIKFNGEVVPGK